VSNIDQPTPSDGSPPVPVGGAGSNDRSSSDDVVELPDAAPLEVVARDLFMHGLIEWLVRRDTVIRENRIQAVMRALDGRPTSAGNRRMLLPRVAFAVAAMIAVAIGITFFVLPSEPSALAEVQRSIKLLGAPGDRRYQARVFSWRDSADARDVPYATIDMRSGMLVVRHRPPGSPGEMTVGRDAAGAWAVREDGTIDRARASRYWPPWSMDGDSLFVAALDRIPEQLARGYTLRRTAGVRIEGSTRLVCDLITATRNGRDGPMPHVVDVWVNRETGLLERIEAKWERAEGEPRGPGARHESPRMIVLQREVTPALPADWFDATAHGRE